MLGSGDEFLRIIKSKKKEVYSCTPGLIIEISLIIILLHILDPKHKKSKVEEFEKERRQEFMMSPGRANNLSLNMTWAYILLTSGFT